jgi:gluconate 2-dehydrogenase gamma chain
MTFSHTVNRRVFLQQAGAASLLAGLMLYKPCIAKEFANKHSDIVNTAFSVPEKAVLNAVQMQLFPADGDGPSAKNINALGYLELALMDAKNIADGDRTYIIEGLTRLEKSSIEIGNQNFIQLSIQQQHQVIETLSKSEKGDNWISLLVYYLLEALLLDPVYGGNTNAAGWAWLGHQAGFPRPSKTKNYRHYLNPNPNQV